MHLLDPDGTDQVVPVAREAAQGLLGFVGLAAGGPYSFRVVSLRRFVSLHLVRVARARVAVEARHGDDSAADGVRMRHIAERRDGRLRRIAEGVTSGERVGLRIPAGPLTRI
jgi:hypothetical protein